MTQKIKFPPQIDGKSHILTNASDILLKVIVKIFRPKATMN